MKKVTQALLVVVLLFFSSVNISYCQTKVFPQVVNATGGHMYNAQMQLDFSVGEVCITSISSDKKDITIGFIQPVFGTGRPANLVGLDGHLSGGQVLLNWNTAEEINSDHFDVEISTDGVLFSKLTSVAGAGTTTSEQSYKAVDPSPSPKVNYYRLKQVAKDGTFDYSNTIAIVVAANKTNFVVSPNPFVSSINIRYSKQQAFQIRILDIGGKLVSQNNYPGTQASVNLSSLANGMYLLQLYSKDGSFIESIKILKQ